MGGEDGPSDISEMWIKTTDPFLAGLPWALARTPNWEPPAARGIPVAVAVGGALEVAGLPANPTMLIAAPEPEGQRSTGAAEHVAELRRVLGGDIVAHANCEILPVVPTTVNALTAEVQKHRPDVLYFYGHGTLTDSRGRVDGELRLLMQKTAEAMDGEEPWSISKLADIIGERNRDAPSLVYLNCCWGGAPGPLGGAIQIGERVHALIANRTSSIMAIARDQAVAILSRILGQNVPPHEALAQVAQRARSGGGVTPRGVGDEPWWLTPTIFANYKRWNPLNSPRRVNRLFTPRETLGLDRTAHWGEVEPRLRETKQPVVVLVWCGSETDGVQALADRLHDEIVSTKDRVRRLVYRPVVWPQESQAAVDWRDLKRLILNQTLRGCFRCAKRRTAEYCTRRE